MGGCRHPGRWLAMLKRFFHKQTPRERLLSRGGVKRERFDTWGEPFYIRAVNASLYLKYNQRLRDASKDGKTVADAEALRLIAELVIQVCVNEDWTPVFTLADVDGLLAQYTVQELQLVLDASLKLSGVTQEAMDRTRADLKKVPSSALPTD